MNRKLETYKAFPLVAWVVFIGFALFVYSITAELRSVSDSLERSTASFNDFNKRIESNSERLDKLEAAAQTVGE